MATPTPDLKTYQGNCHCGAFKFSVKLPEPTSVTECDCSICFKRGYKWVFPGKDNFIIEKGESALTDYEFADKKMAHKFCPICGTGVMGKRHGVSPGMDIGVNARTLQDVNLWDLEVNQYKGADLEPAYMPLKFTGPEPTAEIEGAKIYTGGCHCGAVTIALKTKPLPELADGIKECNCSICARKATIFVYPDVSQVSIIGEQNLTPYSFATNRLAHKFCKICGVPVWVTKGEPKEGASEEEKKRANRMPVNLRCVEGVEWNEIKVGKILGNQFEPKYVVE